MSCSNKNVQDIESIYSKHDDQFKTINSTNIDKYNKLVTTLFQFYISNKENIKPNSDFKEKFNKLYGKLQKRGDIIVKKSFIVYIYQKLVKENILPNDPQFWLYIQKSPARNVSGVNSFALLLSPHPNGQAFSCKHNCYYCPDESRKNGAEDDMPRSYLKNEPAVARGFQNGWDPYNQMMNRMNSLLMQGHEVDKLELIIEGGTYTEFPKSYLETFHRDVFYSANTFYDIEPKREPLELAEEIFINKTTKVRIIGICIETRPDAIDDDWIKFFRNTGTTRIQLGVQHTNNKLLKKINRGHTFEQAVECIKYLKNNCFKVDIHLMPDLPGSTPELDKEMFDIIYNSSIIQPDQTKIYPCEVVPWTVIKQWHESGKYTPYSDTDPKSLVDVITYAMTICPPWVRIPRIVRDIPLTYISGGNTCMNMRQVVDDGLKKNEKLSGDIRSREIGRHLEYNIFDSKYIVRKYEGSESTEYFISLESGDKKVIFGFLRLRIPPKNHDPVYSSIKNTGLVRELHVYNNIVPVCENKKISTQHLGTGKTLVKLAEYISWFYGLEGVSVITGEGVREYYHKRGYESIQSYAVKKFKYKLWKFWLIIYFIQFLSLPFKFSLK
jgi:ELP3 family radical SAM enzyme/protein acetyltransferase